MFNNIMGKLFSKGKSERRHSSRRQGTRVMETTTGDQPGSGGSQVARPRLHDEPVAALSPGPGLSLFSADKDGYLVHYDLEKHRVMFKQQAHEKAITKVRWHEGKGLILTASRDATIRAWSPKMSSRPVTFEGGHSMVVTGITLSPDGNTLFSGSRDNTVTTWDVGSGQKIKTANVPRNLVTDCSWGHQSDFVVQTGEDKELRLWDPRSLSVKFNFPKKRYIQTSCDVSHDDLYCVSSSNGFQGSGCEATLYDLRQRKILSEYVGHRETVSHCQLVPPLPSLPPHPLLITTSNDSTFRLWSRDTRECVCSVNIETAGQITSAAVFPDSTVCVSTFNAGIQQYKLSHGSANPVDAQLIATF